MTTTTALVLLILATPVSFCAMLVLAGLVTYWEFSTREPKPERPLKNARGWWLAPMFAAVLLSAYSAFVYNLLSGVM